MNQPDIPLLLEQRANLKAEQERIKEAINTIDTIIKNTHPDPGTYGNHKLTYRRGLISWRKVEKDFPQNEFPQLYTGFNKTEAENQIAPNILNTYRSEETLLIK